MYVLIPYKRVYILFMGIRTSICQIDLPLPLKALLAMDLGLVWARFFGSNSVKKLQEKYIHKYKYVYKSQLINLRFSCVHINCCYCAILLLF